MKFLCALKPNQCTYFVSCVCLCSWKGCKHSPCAVKKLRINGNFLQHIERNNETSSGVEEWCEYKAPVRERPLLTCYRIMVARVREVDENHKSRREAGLHICSLKHNRFFVPLQVIYAVLSWWHLFMLSRLLYHNNVRTMAARKGKAEVT